jgi:hypothetical protein
MAPPRSRLPLIAILIGAVCFVLALTIQVVTKNPVY